MVPPAVDDARFAPRRRGGRGRRGRERCEWLPGRLRGPRPGRIGRDARHPAAPVVAAPAEARPPGPHALGTLAGALTASVIAASYRAQIAAYAIGAVFLVGGIAASLMIPAPAWFIALDLVVAYLPMAWLGMRIGTRIQRREATAPYGQV